MRALLAFALLASAIDVHAQEFHLPFQGRWFVMQGGDTLNVNQHMSVAAQWYGIDFLKVAGPSQRELSRSTGSTVEDFYSWGEPVLSPVEGDVQAIVDRFPDNPLGVKDADNPAGNHVVIKAASDRYIFIAHLQKGSVKVKPGQHVTAGQELGKCGNSGNSDAPHVHMHLQDTLTLNQGHGQNIVFQGINVEMNGKSFKNVNWPLIRGLFVWKK